MTAEPDPREAAIQERFKRFAQAFEQWVKAAKETHEAVDALRMLIGEPRNGLIPALDELSDEIRGLREDMRTLARSQGGVEGVVDALFGGSRRKR